MNSMLSTLKVAVSVVNVVIHDFWCMWSLLSEWFIFLFLLHLVMHYTTAIGVLRRFIRIYCALMICVIFFSRTNGEIRLLRSLVSNLGWLELKYELYFIPLFVRTLIRYSLFFSNKQPSNDSRTVFPLKI